jgi:hypothetical protein
VSDRDNKNNKRSKSEDKEDLEAAIKKYLSGGGEITKLRYADETDIKSAQRMAFHLDRQHKSERSKKYVENAKQNEEDMIFSKAERNST